MADDKGKTGRQDRIRINVNEDYELGYWAQKFDVSRGRIAEAVKKVGPMAESVAKELGKRL
jgi:predicted DNA-binding protein YlxM (UPF0122 family)